MANLKITLVKSINGAKKNQIAEMVRQAVAAIKDRKPEVVVE